MTSTLRVNKYREKLFEPGNEELLLKYRLKRREEYRRYREKHLSDPVKAKKFRENQNKRMRRLRENQRRAKKEAQKSGNCGKYLKRGARKSTKSQLDLKKNNQKADQEDQSEDFKHETLVLVKVEPSFHLLSESYEESTTSLCRCCFKTILLEEPIEDPMKLSAFEEMTQMKLEPTTIFQTFCRSCCADIKFFNDFRRLAIVRQKKFNEMLKVGLTEFSELSQMTVEDPLEAVVKEEPEDFKLIDFFPVVELMKLDDEEIQKLSNKPERAPKELVKPEKNKKVCEICNKNFIHLEFHTKRAHPVEFKTRMKEKSEKNRQITPEKLENEPETLQTCPYCGKLEDRQKLNRHIQRAHLRTKKLSCDLCGFRTYTLDGITRHMTKHSEKTIKCDSCDFITKTEYRLLVHKQNMHAPPEAKEGEKFECPVCGIFLKTASNLFSHNERKHEKKFLFECKDCCMKFYSNSELTSHRKNIHSEKTFICEMCGKGCGTLKALNVHRSIHSEKKFSCHFCGNKFQLKSKLENHIKCCHLKEKNFKCEHCGRLFFSKHKMKLHMNVHYKIKFNCFIPGCSSSVSRRDALLRHMCKIHRLSGNAREDYLKQLNDYCSELSKAGLLPVVNKF